MKCGGVLQLTRAHEEAHLSALSAVEEQHALAMAHLQQAHDEEMMRQKDRYVVSRHAVQPLIQSISHLAFGTLSPTRA